MLVQNCDRPASSVNKSEEEDVNELDIEQISSRSAKDHDKPVRININNSYSYSNSKINSNINSNRSNSKSKKVNSNQSVSSEDFQEWDIEQISKRPGE